MGTSTSCAISLDAGAPIDYQDRFGDTALMAAVRSGRVDAVRLLLESGCEDVDRGCRGDDSACVGRAPGKAPDRSTLSRQTSRSLKSHHHRPLIPSHGSAVREAAARSLALLERKGGSAWLEQQRCASCHHQGFLLPSGAQSRDGRALPWMRRAHDAQEVRLRTFVATYRAGDACDARGQRRGARALQSRVLRTDDVGLCVVDRRR